MSNSRLGYIDALRGMMIFLVVCSHVALWMDHSDAFVDFFLPLRMPLFFFVSGFLAWADYDKAMLKRRCSNRFWKQLYPTLFILLIYTFITGRNLKSVFFDTYKAGYWFTMSLFSAFIFFAIIAYLIHRSRCSRKQTLAILSAVVVSIGLIGFVLKVLYMDFFSLPAVCLLSFNTTLSLTPYFFLGAIAKLYRPELERYLDNSYLIIAAAIVYTSSIFINYQVVKPFLSCVGIVAMFGLFYKTRKVWQNDGSTAVAALRYMGGKTLQIYLLQYFILDLMVIVAPHIGFSFTASEPLNIVMIIVPALIVIALCLSLDWLLRQVPPLYKFIFHEQKNR
ncbi:MAG: acyltransferase [Muribaculaceae bacterium]|nr:acyltransferase [Muribaculaceae bacterium]